MKNTNPLYESYGEYYEYDDILNSYTGGFKIWWRQLKANWTFFKSLKKLDKESAMINKVIKGLNITVYAFPDADRNAFVIPGFYVGSDKESEKLYDKYCKQYPKHTMFSSTVDFFSVLLNSQIDQLLNMRKFNVVNDPKQKGKKIAIFKNISTPVSIFVTYGTLNAMTPEERLGIYLHEFGHWVDTARNIPRMMIDRKDTESCHLFWVNCLQRYVTRYQELEADNFAKILGYSQELIDGLTAIKNIRKNVLWTKKVGDWFQKRAIERMDEMEKRGELTVMDYPSMSKRIEYLKDDK